MKRKDQKRIFKLTSYSEALERLFKAFQNVNVSYEIVSLEKAFNRISAEDVIAPENVPQNNRALVDGYAINSQDVAEASADAPVFLEVIGKLYPWSQLPGFNLSRGQAIYVTCGAPILSGADAVIMVENTILHDVKIEVRRSVKSGENVVKAGEDIKKGSLILKRGDLLRPQDVGVLAGLGFKSIKVFKKPKVGILATGNELVELKKEDPTRIVDNHALIISGLVSKLGGIPVRIGIAPDNPNRIREKIVEALEKVDIVVTIGGCSVGEKDFVPDVINSLGKPGIIVHGIKVKPGKVTGFGMIKGKPIVMLPGLFASTIAGFYLILAPLITVFTGLKTKHMLPIVTAKISQDVDADMKPRDRFVTIRIKHVEKHFEAEIVSGGASSLSRFLNANGFLLVPPGTSFKKGEEIFVTLFSQDEFARFYRE